MIPQDFADKHRRFCGCSLTPRTQLQYMSVHLFSFSRSFYASLRNPSRDSREKKALPVGSRIPIYFGPMFHNFHLADPAHRGAESLPRRRGKVTRACERCRTFRIKCGEKKPCSRCMNDKVRCAFSSLPSAEEQEQEPTSLVLAGYESSLDVTL